MTSAFDWSKYEQAAQPQKESSSPEAFDWSPYEEKVKKQESSSVGSIFGREALAGGLGSVGDIVNLYDSLVNNDVIKEYNKVAPIPIPQVPEMFRHSGHEDVSKDLQKITGGRPPEDIYERFAARSGSFAGQEGAYGAAIGGVGGPGVAATTGLAGALHGAVSGAVYQAAIELGMSDEGAAIATTLFTLSPIAAKKAFPAVWNKIKNIKTGKGIEKGIIGENLPVSSYETAEKALQEAQKGPFEQLPGGEPPPPGAPPPGASPSLKGRVTTGKLEKGEIPGIAKIGEQEVKEGGRPLAHKVRQDTHSPLNAISKEKFANDANGGVILSKTIKNEAADQRKFVTEAYKKAEESYAGVNGQFPVLSKKLEDIIDQMQQSAKPNSGEKVVIDNAKAVLELIGDESGLIDVPISRLIKTSDSISGIANYDMPYNGPRNILKKMVKDINDEVVLELKRNGADPAIFKDADRIYGEWANKFANDEIAPFLKKDNLNPESTYRSAIKDEGSFRALQQSIGNTKEGKKWLPSYERDFVNEKLKPFMKDLDSVGGRDYQKTIRELKSVIDPKKLAQVDKNLRREAKIRPTSAGLLKPGVEPKVKLAKERITSATQEKPFEIRDTAKKRIHDTLKENYYLDKPQETKFTNQLEKIAKYKKIDPEALLHKLDSRTGIKDLRKDLKPEDFDILKRQKMRSMLRQGNIEHKYTGNKLYEVLNKEENFEIFNEFLGEEVAETARLAAKEVGKRQMTQDAIADLIKKKLLVDYLGRDVIKVLKTIEKIQ